MNDDEYKYKHYPTNTTKKGLAFTYKYDGEYTKVEIQEGLWIAFRGKYFSFGDSPEDAISDSLVMDSMDIEDGGEK